MLPYYSRRTRRGKVSGHLGHLVLMILVLQLLLHRHLLVSLHRHHKHHVLVADHHLTCAVSTLHARSISKRMKFE